MSDKTYARADIPVLVKNIGIVIPNTGCVFGHSGNIMAVDRSLPWLRVFASPQTKVALAECMLERKLDTSNPTDHAYLSALKIPFGTTGDYLREATKADMPLIVIAPESDMGHRMESLTGEVKFDAVEAAWLYLQIRLRSRAT